MEYKEQSGANAGHHGSDRVHGWPGQQPGHDGMCLLAGKLAAPAEEEQKQETTQSENQIRPLAAGSGSLDGAVRPKRGPDPGNDPDIPAETERVFGEHLVNFRSFANPIYR